MGDGGEAAPRPCLRRPSGTSHISLAVFDIQVPHHASAARMRAPPRAGSGSSAWAKCPPPPQAPLFGVFLGAESRFSSNFRTLRVLRDRHVAEAATLGNAITFSRRLAFVIGSLPELSDILVSRSIRTLLGRLDSVYRVAELILRQRTLHSSILFPSGRDLLRSDAIDTVCLSLTPEMRLRDVRPHFLRLADPKRRPPRAAGAIPAVIPNHLAHHTCRTTAG